MKRFHSIRWRLQLWHGLLLAFVLAGFVFMAWRLQRATQFQRVDQDLEERISAIAGKLPRGGEDPRQPSEVRPSPDRAPLGNPQSLPLEALLSERDLSLFEGPPGKAFYFVVWQRDDQEGSRSATAPPNATRPERIAGPRDSRLRGTLRERFHFLPRGGCILVGRDIGDELAGIRRFAWLLAGIGASVLALGWTGGRWISKRALRPIADISATAARISTGDLGQRIPISDTDSELGDLVRVLNETFARLQASFARQTQFTADASHELRTPVSVVLTQTQTALGRERPAAEYRESLEACQRAAQRMRRLIESLLTLARLDSGEAAAREHCGLDRVALEAVELLLPLARDQKITLEIVSEPTPCEGSSEQFGQVVSNLVTNAIACNRPGGSVKVSVFNEPGAAVATVCDTGQGIAAEDIPHIFERFYRADKARSGASGRAGLGLAISKAIIEALGGTIDVISEQGKGSTFTVRLPLRGPRSS